MSVPETHAMLDYPDLIARTLLDDEALAIARMRWEIIAPTLFRERERVPGSLRVSDAGSCVRQLWADVHDALDIPESHDRLSRMNSGTLDGAWTACLVAAGITRWHSPMRATLEGKIEGDGIPGHVDIIVWPTLEATLPLEVVECKWTASAFGSLEPPDVANKKGEDKRYHIYQACKYATGIGAETFVVLYHAPAMTRSDTRVAFRYFTSDWQADTAAEYERLAQALDYESPDGDAREEFRCRSCRYSDCERNANPLNVLETVDVIVDTEKESA